MQVYVPLLAIVVILVASTESKPSWSNLYIDQYSPASSAEALTELNLQQTPIFQYPQQAYSPFYIYNVQTELKDVPAAVIAHGKPAISHIPAYGFYYGQAVYDFRFPFSPVLPTLKPVEPSTTPKPESKPTDSKPSTAEKEDGVEKLDNKVESPKKMEKPTPMEHAGDDDSVVIESI
ncbi:uncharacterized protein LOC116429891 [Nomia melanderi]|uniref:uncharacterized protein LOC116429891 n=1 Tax=Nomia melanderi TaxID=2448451 RepID=UPI001304163A|nr:uncharacterized protein LOC116429891 [Nomia melanderi]